MDPWKGEKFRREEGGKEKARVRREETEEVAVVMMKGEKKNTHTLEENLSGGNPTLCPPTIRILLLARGITIFSRCRRTRIRKENAGILGPEISETGSQTVKRALKGMRKTCTTRMISDLYF